MVSYGEMPRVKGRGTPSFLFGRKKKDLAFPVERILTPRQKIEACINECGCDGLESAIRCAKKSIAIMRTARTFAELDSCAALLSSRLGIAKEIILDEATGRCRCM